MQALCQYQRATAMIAVLLRPVEAALPKYTLCCFHVPDHAIVSPTEIVHRSANTRRKHLILRRSCFTCSYHFSVYPRQIDILTRR
ncbi:hypothetical protein EV126DRAFT_208941 [Verticillium dahliae]|nr:hypothetical protein EV126DRAFT_208941 [Verticillium dahliae]